MNIYLGCEIRLMKQFIDQNVKVLIFRVGQEEYGVQISQVVSIEQLQEINSYPNRQAHVLGVTTVRDVVIPVVDMRSALSAESLIPSDSGRMIIVKVSNGQEIGIVVDAATDVTDLPRETIQQPSLLAEQDISYLTGVSKIGDRLIILLDIEKLLENTTNLDELKEIIHSL